MKNFGGDFKLIVNQNYGHMEVEIYGQVIQGNKLFMIGYDGENLIQTEITEQNQMTAIKEFKALLKVAFFQFESLVKAFVDIANERQIHTVEANLIEGKLSATERHLIDMQEMSKKLLDAFIGVKIPKVIIAHEDKIEIIKGEK